MFLFILESIGMSEMILIGIVALIIFGPRKLPGMARTIGKTIADLKKTTNEFKETWEKESSMSEIQNEMKDFSIEISKIKKISMEENFDQNSNSIQTNIDNQLPQIMERDVNELQIPKIENSQTMNAPLRPESNKQTWL